MEGRLGCARVNCDDKESVFVISLLYIKNKYHTNNNITIIHPENDQRISLTHNEPCFNQIVAMRQKRSKVI